MEQGILIGVDALKCKASKCITIAAATAAALISAGEHTALVSRANLPTQGQNASPKHKTYKFGILSMMSCLKMISWQRK